MKSKGLWAKATMAAVFLMGLAAGAPQVLAIEQPFQALEKRLIHDGFDAQKINALFSSPKSAFETRGVSLYFVHREAKLNYGQFTSAASIAKARTYIQRNGSELQRIETAYGVDKEIITAIMLVETGLGTVLGKRSVFNTYSSLASLQDPRVRDQFWAVFDRKDQLSRQAFDKKADRKAAWAYKQLKALLRFAEREAFDPAAVRGSYAGALGIAQFIPTTALAYAQDGNADGRIDLFDHVDAMASIAGFLKQFGWHAGISDQKKKSIIHRYNHSTYYVNTILKIDRLLKTEATGEG